MMMSAAMGTCAAEAGSTFGALFSAALHFFALSQCDLKEPWPAHANIANGTSFDFVIVGGGTAGATLAARLSVTNYTVLLLEAGPDPPLETIVPRLKDHAKASGYDWNFKSVNDSFSSQSLDGGRQVQLRGKMLGGTSSLNDMVYSRGFPQDYEEWATIGGDQWNWTNVLEHFKRTEYLTDERIINDMKFVNNHGRSGEMEVGGFNATTFATQKFLDAFKELGFNETNDMTSPAVNITGRFSHTIRGGRRESPVTALLNKAAATQRNLYVMKETHVDKILMDNNKNAIGVEATHNGKTLKLFANKEVIISAGAYNTAKLLILSGIGPRDHLRELNVPEVQDLPVGDNLHDHVMAVSYIRSENGTCYSNKYTHYMDAVRYLYDRTGLYSRTNSMGAYLSLSKSSNVPDYAIYANCMAIDSKYYDGCRKVLGFNHNICHKLTEENKNKELIALAVVLLNPKSRGKVRLNSNEVNENPLIYSNTFANIDDLTDFPKALDFALSIINSTYFRKKNAQLVDLDIPECRLLSKLEKLNCTIMATATSAWHGVGTAAMGQVVDSKLKVKGVKKLRVVDGAVMPRVIRGDTSAAIVMIAEKAADFIKVEYGVKALAGEEIESHAQPQSPEQVGEQDQEEAPAQTHTQSQ